MEPKSSPNLNIWHIGHYGASINVFCPQMSYLDHCVTSEILSLNQLELLNMTFRRVGASINVFCLVISKLDHTCVISEIWSLNQLFLYRNCGTGPQHVISDNWSQNQFQLEKKWHFGDLERQSMFSVPKVWNSTRICHFEDLEPPIISQCQNITDRIF